MLVTYKDQKTKTRQGLTAEGKVLFNGVPKTNKEVSANFHLSVVTQPSVRYLQSQNDGLVAVCEELCYCNDIG